MPKAIILYQFFPPDSVVSSTLYGDLAQGLVAQGWEVEVYPCNRNCKHIGFSYTRHERWNGVNIHRQWRPDCAQSSSKGRIINAVWMIWRWSLLGLHPGVKADVVIVGTDPILGVLSMLAWKLFKPKTVIVHWCFDLYPEAAIADGILSDRSIVTNALRRLAAVAYRRCDLIVDIGSCMKQRLAKYKGSSKRVTITPWALSEPPEVLEVDVTARKDIFGDAILAILYAGSLGHAHSYHGALQLARELRQEGVVLAFGSSIDSQSDLKAALKPDDTNIVFAEPVPISQLSSRLSSADIHLVTLKEEWTGLVVPSKFFGALSIGRPVLFCGSEDSEVARLIRQHEVGWVMTHSNTEAVIAQIKKVALTPGSAEAMRAHCFQVYGQYFSKKAAMDYWNYLLSVELDY